MQNLTDLVCTDCGKDFSSASMLLQHFAEHVFSDDQKVEVSLKKSGIPDLYPVNLKKKHVKEEIIDELTDENIAKYCEVAIIEDVKAHVSLNNLQQDGPKRSYKCGNCKKSFGWSTDLKRHMLVHTGERPFKCKYCPSNFTRNFILQNHVSRVHSDICRRMNIPDLKPIFSVSGHKCAK